jgi:prepilin-type N-terminal cleavage/methylation domain-containing protein
MKKQNGFSLLELLIVVAIILIIATIAIPSLLRSRQAANEAHAVANLRTLNTAEVNYITGHKGEYGNVPELVTAGLLDVVT